MTFTVSPDALVLDWTSWLSFHFPDAQRALGGRDEWLVLCPFHADRNPSCAVNTAKGVFICRSCGKAGQLKAMQEKIGGGSPRVSVSAAALRTRLNEAAATAGILPFFTDSWLAQFSPDERGYWTEGRGLLESTVEHYRLCIDDVHREAIIPVFWQGSLRGVIRRAMLPGIKPKYKFPRHLPRKEMLWGYDQVRGGMVNKAFGERPVMLTEGQIDAMAGSETGARTVAIGGNLLMKGQYNHLMRLNPTSVIVALDNDDAGRGQPASGADKPTGVWRIASMVRRVPLFVVDWDPYKDPAEVRDLAERTEYVLAATPWRVWRKQQ